MPAKIRFYFESAKKNEKIIKKKSGLTFRLIHSFVIPLGSQQRLSYRLTFSHLFHYCKDTDNFFISQTFCNLFLIFIRFKNKKSDLIC